MNVAMVSMNAGPLACLGGVDGGGQSVVVDCLSRALSFAGHQVTIYAHRDDPSLPECSTTSAGVHIDYVGAKTPLRSAAPVLLEAIETFRARLFAEWTVNRPDVVHAHSWISGKAALDAAHRLGLPVVQTFYGLEQPKRRRTDTGEAAPLRIAQEAALVQGVARIIASSSAEVFTLLGMGASPGAIKFIPCGVDLEVFHPSLRRAAKPGEPLRIATLSRLVPEAGVGDVIEALSFVDGAELIVGGGHCAGSGLFADPDAQALRALAQARGVAERVTFHGHVKRDEVAAFLRSADIVVCSPWHDSIATVALEAMACGMPVIVSTVGGLVDAVADGMTGTHVPPRASRQLAYAIEALKTDAMRRERYGRFGVERTSARYGWSRIAADTSEVYRSVALHNAQLSQSRA